MSEFIFNIVHRIMLYKRSMPKDTEYFENKKHNDYLCPTLQNKIEDILTSYGKYENVVYDTQGLLDSGSDIILRFGETSTEMDNIIGFQIKSFDDLNKSDYMRTIKAQRDDSFRKVINIKNYFILLCTNGIKHKEKIRMIEAEFRSAEKTVVIEPQYAYSLYNLPSHRIHAIVTRNYEAYDIVMKKAIESIQYDSPISSAFSVYFSILLINGSTGISISEFKASKEIDYIYRIIDENEPLGGNSIKSNAIENDEVYDDYDGYISTRDMVYEERILNDITFLDGQAIQFDASNEYISFDEKQLLPLIALITDAMVRYDYSTQDVLPYMLEVLGIADT